MCLLPTLCTGVGSHSGGGVDKFGRRTVRQLENKMTIPFGVGQTCGTRGATGYCIVLY